ncbi:MAG: dienelactone hydrolase family protein [Cyanobacteriota bacterium]|nr:dienelactone hydrolase family protein [Cyanobacteriota bacterium]
MPLPAADWVAVPLGAGQEPLRCWWSRPDGEPPRAAVLVLPEVFGVNGWVRSVADRLALAGYGALAVPLFHHTAPTLELGYSEAELRLGRSHKERTSAAQLLADLAAAVTWLDQQVGPGPIGCVGFCFGGHVAMLAATLPQVRVTCACYGAGVVSGRPGGGPPTVAVVPQIGGHLLCLYGNQDPLIPPADVEAVQRALEAAGPGRHRLRVLNGGHGFLCDARADHDPAAAQEGWREIMAWLERVLGPATAAGA